MVPLGPRRPVDEFAAAICAHVIQRIGTLGAIGTLERADERAGGFGGKVRAAAFAIGAHFQSHYAAAFSTA